MGVIKLNEKYKMYKKGKLYLDNTMYKYNENMGDIFKNTKEVYNPIPKAFEKLEDRIMKGFEITVNDSIKNLFEESKKENNYTAIAKELIKAIILDSRHVVLELVKVENKNILNVLDGEMIKYLKEKNGRVTDLRIEGEDDYEKKITKEYINKIKDGIHALGYKIDGGDLVQTTENLIHRLNCNYRLDVAYNKIDKINEFKYFTYSLGSAMGNPKLFGKLLSEILEDTKNKFDAIKEKYTKTLDVIIADEKDSELKFIELSGAIIAHFQNEVKELKEELLEDFPEFSLGATISGSNISAETVAMRQEEIISKIDNIRKEITEAFKYMFRIMFRTTEDISISFSSLKTEDTTKTVAMYQELEAQGIISIQTFQEKLEKLNIITSVEEEQKRINEEAPVM